MFARREPVSGRRVRRDLVWILSLATTAFVLVVIVAPGLIAPSSPNAIDTSALLAAPSWNHLFGTNELGQDLFSRVVYGTRTEAAIGFGSIGVALALGIPTGLAAGLTHRAVDEVLTSLGEGVLAFPIVLLGVLIVASLGASAMTLVAVLSLVFWPQVHLVVRGQAKALAEREFVLAAEVMNLGRRKVIARHVLPHMLNSVAVLVPQLVAVAILTEAGLSYLGLGLQPPAVSWGTIMYSSEAYYQQAPWYALITGAVITFSAAGLMLIGDRVARRIGERRMRILPWRLRSARVSQEAGLS